MNGRCKYETGNVHLLTIPCCTFLATATPHAWKLEILVLLFHQNSRRGTAYGVQNICMRQLVLVFSLCAFYMRGVCVCVCVCVVAWFHLCLFSYLQFYSLQLYVYFHVCVFLMLVFAFVLCVSMYICLCMWEYIVVHANFHIIMLIVFGLVGCFRLVPIVRLHSFVCVHSLCVFMCLGWLGSIVLGCGCVGLVVFGRLPSNQKQIFWDTVIHCDTPLTHP